MRNLLLALFAATLGLAAPAAAVAQGETVHKEDPSARQSEARQRFLDLQRKMQELQVVLSTTAPDESRVLKAGNRHAQEARIQEQMLQVSDLLAQERWDEALERMNDVRTDLADLLRLLENRELDLDKLADEIKRLEAFRDRVDKLIDEQQREKDDAARAEELEQRLRDLEEARQQVDQLVEEQKRLRDATAGLGLAAQPKTAAEMAGKQGELKEGAESLSKKLDELEKKAGEPKHGDGGSGSCAGACAGAAKAMGESQQKLQQNKPDSSLEHQDQAIARLEQAREELEKLSEEVRRQLMQIPFEQQIRAQEMTQAATAKLAEDMKAGEQGDGGKQTPGKKNVQQAVPKQKAAAGQLKERKPGKAKQDQQDARDELEQAKKELEDALAQLRQEMQDEVLKALEERLSAMLVKQREISALTKVTHRLRTEAGGDSVPAAIQQRCAAESTGESELQSSAHDGLMLLREEGTSAVFPELFEELEADLGRIADRLAGFHAGETTQTMQAEVENLMQMLLDALKKQIEDNQQGGNCNCNGQPPLVPLSAELKVILQLQKRVAARTKEFDSAVPQPLRVTEEARAGAQEISRKQGRVEDLTRKLAIQLNKNEEAARREEGK